MRRQGTEGSGNHAAGGRESCPKGKLPPGHSLNGMEEFLIATSPASYHCNEKWGEDASDACVSSFALPYAHAYLREAKSGLGTNLQGIEACSMS